MAETLSDDEMARRKAKADAASDIDLPSQANQDHTKRIQDYMKKNPTLYPEEMGPLERALLQRLGRKRGGQ